MTGKNEADGNFFITLIAAILTQDFYEQQIFGLGKLTRKNRSIKKNWQKFFVMKQQNRGTNYEKSIFK